MENADDFKINLLRFLTGRQIPDEILKTIQDIKISEKGELSFVARMSVNAKDWKYIYGACEFKKIQEIG